ncbi:MAG: phosphatidylserine decarboxylase [Candidatus Parcubacteria bacterium]|nr:phosphatidylserine decarboxylase [Burkholderiales bacterium]
MSAAALGAGAYAYWRYVWFWRNPARVTPAAEGVVSAADGTVVYVKTVAPGEAVVSIKQGLSARLADIMREDADAPKLLIGVFMSPFDVHHNRAPISGEVEFVKHHPGRGANLHMGPMHWRILRRREPYYEGSGHIVQNERTVTKIRGRLRGEELSCYVVQIAAKTVAGIDSYVKPGEAVQRGAIFGMIRIGSQVDLVLPWREGMRVRVRPGDRVRAGETLLCD